MDKKEKDTLHRRFQDQVQRYGDRRALMFKREGKYEEISWSVFGR